MNNKLTSTIIALGICSEIFCGSSLAENSFSLNNHHTLNLAQAQTENVTQEKANPIKWIFIVLGGAFIVIIVIPNLIGLYSYYLDVKASQRRRKEKFEDAMEEQQLWASRYKDVDSSDF